MKSCVPRHFLRHFPRSLPRLLPGPVHCLLAAGLALPGAVAADWPDDESLTALHWHPQTAGEARTWTAAAALTLAEGGEFGDDPMEAVRARRLQLQRLLRQVDPSHFRKIDGRFGTLVLAAELSRLGESAVRAAPPASTGVRALPADATAAYRAAALVARVARQPATIWNDLRARLGEDSAEPPEELAALAARYRAAEDPDRDYARAQAGRLLADPADLTGLELARAERQWAQEAWLAAAWTLLDVAVQALEAEPGEAGRILETIGRLEAVSTPDSSEVRAVDPALPLVLALISDAMEAWSAGERRQWARNELSHAYARLALFLPEADYYLDQPVRQQISEGLTRCAGPSLLGEPLAREFYEGCLEAVFGLLLDALQVDELTGSAGDTYADEFLRREMELATWQRGDYLLGHLDWVLGGSCPEPASINILEWSLLTELLARWAPMRPVYFGSEQWQSALEETLQTGASAAAAVSARVACAGADAGDPLAGLMAEHRRHLGVLEDELARAIAEFRSTHLRPGADVDLQAGGFAAQTTAYRPEDLVLGPCGGEPSCGVRIQLPVSRALAGLFPDAFLLADQSRLGELGMCYEGVRWVQRRRAPARAGDDSVANYFGRLSFDLVGYYRTGGEEREVFRRRLVDDQERLYLFAADDDALLERECPAEVIGEPVASELPASDLRLVPRRLTYFASAPVTPERLLALNWDRGAEWRDWFLSSDRVEVRTRADGGDLMTSVSVHLSELAGRQERVLGQRLLRQPANAESDPLTGAMSSISDNAAFMRRVAELLYPVQIRHDPQLRGALAGERGLLNRDRMRTLQSGGLPVRQVPQVAISRLEALRQHWQSLPAELREGGQPAPELVTGIERLRNLERLRPPASDFGPQPQAPRNSPPPDQSGPGPEGGIRR